MHKHCYKLDKPTPEVPTPMAYFGLHSDMWAEENEEEILTNGTNFAPLALGRQFINSRPAYEEPVR